MDDHDRLRELLDGLQTGRYSFEDFHRWALDHLIVKCPGCAETVQDWQRGQPEPGSEYAGAFAAARAVFEGARPYYERIIADAHEAFERLMMVPGERRMEVVLAGGSGYRGFLLAERLIEESRKQIPADPQASLHFAELAQTVAFLSGGGQPEWEAQAMALARVANAQRVLGDSLSARQSFAALRGKIKARPLLDPTALAEIDSLEASLHYDLRQLPIASALLESSMRYSRAGGDGPSLMKCLVQLGNVQREMGETHEAITTMQTALTGIDSLKEPRLALCAAYGLGMLFCDAERFQEAQASYDDAQELFGLFDDSWSQLRRRWLCGRIYHGQGDPLAAEAEFVAAREGFAAKANCYDTASVSLDLALVYLDQQRHQAVQELADEMVAAFQAEGVHREVLAALVLFQKAAEAIQVTKALVRKLGRYLNEARHNPEMPFEVAN